MRLLITDPTDKAIFVSFVNTARSAGQGWVEYMWPKPGKKSPSKKITYIYRVPGKDLFVAAGIYARGGAACPPLYAASAVAGLVGGSYHGPL